MWSFKRADTSDKTPSPVFSPPRAGNVAKLKYAIGDGAARKTPGAAASDWLYRCSRLDRVTSSEPIPIADQKGAGARVGVLRSHSRARTAESESKTLRRDWCTDREDTDHSSDPASSVDTGSSAVTAYYANNPYGPIEKALSDYRLAYQQRAKRRAHEKTENGTEPLYNYPATDSDAWAASVEDSALPLGISAPKKVTWVDMHHRDKADHACKSVRWSHWVEVYHI